MDDAELLRRARERDPVALERIYERYADRIYRYIRAFVGEREMAEDMTAEVFVRMLEAVERSRFARHSLSGWLYRVAHNLVVDEYRRRGPRIVGLEAAVAVSEPAVEMVEQERVRQALVHLTPEQQQVIVLRFGQGLKAKEIGAVMGKSEAAVRKLQQRALAALRRVLRERR